MLSNILMIKGSCAAACYSLFFVAESEMKEAHIQDPNATPQLTKYEQVTSRSFSLVAESPTGGERLGNQREAGWSRKCCI